MDGGDEVAGRVRALASGAATSRRTASGDAPGRWVPGAADGDVVVGDGAELRRRALTSALEAYTAVHGHPVGGERAVPAGTGPVGDRDVRWVTRPRVAAVAAVTVLVLAAVVGARALGHVPSVPVERSDAAEVGGPVTGPADDGRGPGGTAGPGTSPTAPTEPAVAEVVVHVVGEVGDPGLVRLPVGARVADALEAAGGPTRRADLAGVNLARPVVDGEQVHVPRPGEVPAATADGPGTAAGGPTTVDLNAADAAALEALPGIGPVLAERIVAWRATNGRFTSVDELGEVSGVGPKVLDGLRDHVRVG